MIRLTEGLLSISLQACGDDSWGKWPLHLAIVLSNSTSFSLQKETIQQMAETFCKETYSLKRIIVIAIISSNSSNSNSVNSSSSSYSISSSSSSNSSSGGVTISGCIKMSKSYSIFSHLTPQHPEGVSLLHAFVKWCCS